MNNIKENLYKIALMIFMLFLPVLALAQITPGWCFQRENLHNTNSYSYKDMASCLVAQNNKTSQALPVYAVEKECAKQTTGLGTGLFIFFYQTKATTTDTKGPFSKEDCTTESSDLNSIGIKILKNCYEIKVVGSNPPSAVGSNPPAGDNTKIENPITKANTINGLIKLILEGIIKISIPIITLAVIYSGFLFVFAQGKPEDLKKAKDALLYTLIGAAILLGSWAIAQLISDTVLKL